MEINASQQMVSFYGSRTAPLKPHCIDHNTVTQHGLHKTIGPAVLEYYAGFIEK